MTSKGVLVQTLDDLLAEVNRDEIVGLCVVSVRADGATGEFVAGPIAPLLLRLGAIQWKLQAQQAQQEAEAAKRAGPRILVPGR